MKLTFYKYHGAGNDFIIFDNRKGALNNNQNAWYHAICHRRFGIGADGVLLLQNNSHADFEMLYFNADGNEGSMCGNGGRCIVSFAKSLGIINNKCVFIAVDGLHEAQINNELISLKMNDVNDVMKAGDDYELNTGSPHYIKFVDDISQFNVKAEGARIRYSQKYKEQGINVNFLQSDNEKLFMRTYERGVEDETFSCGTGVTAAALVCHYNKDGYNNIKVKTPGGNLSVSFEKYENTFTNIWLSGPADKVFEGVLEISEMGIE